MFLCVVMLKDLYAHVNTKHTRLYCVSVNISERMHNKYIHISGSLLKYGVARF